MRRWPARFRGGRGLRLKPGERNQLESAYEAEVLIPARNAGTILEFWFQSFTFKLASDCRYTPDFVILTPSGVLEIHEVKGSQKIKRAGTDPEAKLGSKPFVEGDARVKLRVFAEKFPFRCLAVFKRRLYEGGGWGQEEFTAWSDGEQPVIESA